MQLTKTNKYLTALLILGSVAIPFSAHAGSYGQTDASYEYPLPDSSPSHSSYLGQYVGNTATGTPSTLSLYFRGSGTFTPRIYTCPDSQSVNTFDTNCTYISADQNMTLTSTKTRPR